MASLGDLQSELTSRLGSLGTVFGKPKKADAAPGAPTVQVPDIPISRVLETQRRRVGKGRRDTILNGADGLQ
jgi:hypothetical protein